MASDPKDGEFDQEERSTLVSCLACGGDWLRSNDDSTSHQHIICRWCTQGAMTADQAAAWKTWRIRHKSSP